MRFAFALSLTVALGCASVMKNPATDTGPPNLILIVSDDQGYGDYGFMGSTVAKTPSIDRLAREGSYFPIAYNTGSVCQPSLGSLLTGVDPKQWEATEAHFSRRNQARPQEKLISHFDTLPRILSRHGYATYQAGKLWNGTHEMAGFREGLKTEDVVGLQSTLAWAGGEESLAIGRTTLDPVTEFIDENRDQPFFIWFAPMLPHTPHDAPKTYEDLYKDMGLSGRERRYFANVTRLDDAIGSLVAHLERRGLRERTLIVFLSDNGWQPGSADDENVYLGGAKGKASMFELGWRTPLVFSWPGTIPAGEVRSGLVSTLDLFPTLLSYAGASPPRNRSGRNLAGVLRGDHPVGRKALYGSDLGDRPREPARGRLRARAPAFFARTGRWHYVWNTETGSDELYDVLQDPSEEQSVASDHPRAVARFRRNILDWYETVREPLLPAVR